MRKTYRENLVSRSGQEPYAGDNNVSGVAASSPRGLSVAGSPPGIPLENGTATISIIDISKNGADHFRIVK